MSDTKSTPPSAANPPISSAAPGQPQDTLLMRGAFDAPSTPGTLGRLGRFEIIRLLGEGGMGQVYLAREPLTDTQVAIKIMKPAMACDPQAVHRFLTEARHMYRMSHPRILRVLEVSDRKEGPYYVMPYITGGSLRGQYRPGEPLADERVIAIARQVAEALAHAHARGLIHRDLKPDNVLLDRDGNAFLTDFGLVRTVFNDSMVDTAASHLEGTAPYMSPAVARGDAEDTRCDIYAFGALLYELLAGKLPYTGRTPQMILDQVIKGPPPPIREGNPKANPALVRIAEGCMARELRDRYATMADVVSDLERVTKGVAPLGPHQKRRQRLPRMAALAAAALVVAVVSGMAAHQFLSAKTDVRPSAAGLPTTLEGRALAPLRNAEGSRPPSGEGPRPQESGAVIETDEPSVDNPTRAAIVSGTLTNGSFAYTVTNGAVTIAKYTGPGGAVVIPSKVNGLPVTGIGGWAFAGCTNMTSVTIPNGIVSFGLYSFADCTGLTQVSIPASVVSGWGDPFRYCSALTAIKVDPANPAFSSSLDGVVFSKDKTRLVSYPAGKAGGYVIPDGVTSLDPGAFENCPKLTGVTIPTSVTDIRLSAFLGCTGLTSLTIPDGVTSIGTWAFRHTGLTNVTFSDSVTALGGGAFLSCVKLTGLYFEGDAPSLGTNAFSGVHNKATIYYRPGTKGWGKEFGGVPTAVWEPEERSAGKPVGLTEGPFNYAVTNREVTITGYTGAGGDIVLPSAIKGLPVTGIGAYAFEKGNLAGVAIPASITNISEREPFFRCHRLASIAVDPANPTFSSDDGVLFDKAKRTLLRCPNGKAGDYAIPDGVTRVGHSAFWRRKDLSSVTVPLSIEEIAPWAFAECGGLTGVYFRGDAPVLGDAALKDSTNAIVYYRAGATGWGKEFGGRPTAAREPETTRADPADAIVQGPFVCVLAKGTLMLARYKGPGGKVTIPQEVKDIPVEAIGAAAFLNCSNVTDVIIPDGVVSIDAWAFRNCHSLTNVTIPKSVTAIGYSAFCSSRKLSAIGVDEANPAYCSEDGVVFSKDRTTLIVCPAGKRGNYDIPRSVTRIENGAFTVSSLSGVTIPADLASIGNEFVDCRELVSITANFANPEYSSIDGALFNKDQTLLVRYPSGRAGPYAIPDSVAEIGPSAFMDNLGLTGVTLPSGVTNLNARAFRGCVNLKAICFEGNTPAFGPEAFRGLSANARVFYRPASKGWGKEFGGLPTAVWEHATTTAASPTAMVQGPFAYTTTDGKVTIAKYTGPGMAVTIPETINGLPVVGIGGWVFNGCGNLTSVTIPDSVIRIEAFAFGKCSSLKSLTLPARVSCIGGWAFNDCRSLTSVVIPSGVTNIEDRTFHGCTALTSVTIPASVTRIGDLAFGKCLSLKSAVIPRGVTSIGSGAFKDCVALTSVEIPPGVASIAPASFYACTALTSAVMPAGVARIEDSAFEKCSSLKSVTIPRSVASIGPGAFKDCVALTSVEIPPGVTSIAAASFYACTALTSAIMPEGVAHIDDSAFEKCNSLKSAAIPRSVTNIGSRAFNDCAALAAVEIPRGVTRVANHAFMDCSSLTSLVIPPGVAHIGDNAFSGCSALGSVWIASDVTAIGQFAFCGCPSLRGVYFEGPVPIVGRSAFLSTPNVTVYYRPGANGWGKEFGGRPTAVWDGKSL